MRIAFLISHLSNGGAERAISLFANALVNRGEEVHILCINRKQVDYHIDERVKLHLLGDASKANASQLRGVREMMSYVKYMRGLSADVIIPVCVRAKFYIEVLFVKLFTKTRFVFCVRNNPQEDMTQEKNKRWIRNGTTLFADSIWLQCDEQRQFFPKRLQKKAFVVPNILSRQFLSIPERHRERICRFISVGRLHLQKNHRMLIQAFANMIERTGNQDATLTIYGKAGKDQADVEEGLKLLIRQLHLETRVFLPGRAQDIETKYAEADAFVLGSNYEGFPNALMEAMAAGLPCISTACPTGPSTLIDHGKDGLLVPVGDVDAMSRAMENLVTDSSLANQMGTAAKQKMAAWKTTEELAELLRTNLRKTCS